LFHLEVVKGLKKHIGEMESKPKIPVSKGATRWILVD